MESQPPPPPPPPGPPPKRRQRMRGHELLSEIVASQHHGVTAWCARHLQISDSAISRWLSNNAVPSYDVMVRLRDTYGIPLEAWHEPADA